MLTLVITVSVFVCVQCVVSTDTCENSDTWKLLMSKNQTELWEPPIELPNVTVATVLVNFYDLHEMQEHMKIHLVLHRQWSDSRMNVGCNHPPLHIAAFRQKHIWDPNVIILNNLKTEQGRVVNGEPDTSLMIFSGGLVKRMDSIVVTTHCSMNFLLFPFDWMMCDLALVAQPIAFNLTLISVQTEQDGVHNNLATHQLERVQNLSQRITSAGSLYNREMTAATIRIIFRRYSTIYFFQFFIPLLLTCLVAWCSFFVDPKSIPARVTMCLSALLAMILQYQTLEKAIPKVGYTKVIDIVMVVLMCFIFSAIVEFAYLCYVMRKTQFHRTACAQIEQRLWKIDRNAQIAYVSVLVSVTASTTVVYLIL